MSPFLGFPAIHEHTKRVKYIKDVGTLLRMEAQQEGRRDCSKLKWALLCFAFALYHEPEEFYNCRDTTHTHGASQINGSSL